MLSGFSRFSGQPGLMEMSRGGALLLISDESLIGDKSRCSDCAAVLVLTVLLQGTSD